MDENVAEVVKFLTFGKCRVRDTNFLQHKNLLRYSRLFSKHARPPTLGLIGRLLELFHSAASL